ncbi:MAG: VanZ family protein [Dehalococcoidia bacterium]|nr:VanZ family protein [Dehalococcoidia bacterium]
MNLVFLGNFGLKPKSTVSARAAPLAGALIAKGHTVTVVVPPWDNPSDSGRAIMVGKVPVLNLRLPPRIPILWYFLLTWRLLRLTLSLRPEIVHAFKPKGFSGLVATSLGIANHFGISKVRVVVDTDDWEGEGGWNDIAGYSLAKRLFFPFQEKWVLRHSDSVTVASRSLALMVATIRGKTDNVFYVPNAVEASAEPLESSINWQRPGRVGSRVMLLYTRFFEFRVGRVLDVLARVANRIPDVKLQIVGKGLFGEEAEMQRLAAERGLASQVVNAGWVEPADLPYFFAMADVAIYPFDDTLINRTKCSVKLIELLNAGLPVVADRVGQNAEYIEDGKSGLLVEPGDSQAMAKAVITLLEEPETASRMGCSARQRIQSEFNWDNWAGEAERAYQKAAEKEPKFKHVFTWLPPILWMGLIFHLSSQSSLPQMPEPLLQTIVAKLVHLGSYAILALLLFRAFRLQSLPSGTFCGAMIFSVLASILFAASDEFHQSFTPGRHSALIDVFVDLVGASAALLVYAWKKRLVWRCHRRQGGRRVHSRLD